MTSCWECVAEGVGVSTCGGVDCAELSDDDADVELSPVAASIGIRALGGPAAGLDDAQAERKTATPKRSGTACLRIQAIVPQWSVRALDWRSGTPPTRNKRPCNCKNSVSHDT